MSRHQKDPLRSLNDEEQIILTQIAGSQNEPASHVARSKILLAVAMGSSYTKAAQAAGRRSYEAVSSLVSRFNSEGLSAIEPRHGGGAKKSYDSIKQSRRFGIHEARREPDREKDGTATWSLSTLQKALRRAGDGLPNVSTYTIWQTLHQTGWSW